MILQVECHPQVPTNKIASPKGKIMNNISYQKPIAPKFVPTTTIVQDQDQIHHIATTLSASPLMMAESTVSSTVQAAGHHSRGGGNSSGGGGARRKIAFMHPTLGYPIAAPLPAKVARRNARERNRVKQVNCGFEVLRNHIPSAAKQKKMSKVDTLRHAVDYIEKLQHILREQHIDVNVSTCGSKNDQKLLIKEEDPISSTANSSSSVVSVVSERNIASQNNKPLKQNNRNRNGKNISQRENKSIAPKCASRSNLPPPLIMLPKMNQQSVSPYHQQHHQPSTPSSSSGCSSPSINSPLLGSTNQHSIMNFNQNNNTSPNQQNYPPPLTPRTPSNSSGNTNNFCQFMDGSPSPGVGIASTPSIMTNESGYDSMSASFYNSPTSPQNNIHPMAPHPHMIQQSPMRQMPEQPHSSSPMEYHHQNYQQNYQVPCTPPASSIHSHQSLYNSAQHQPNRSSIIDDSVPHGMDDSFHLTTGSSSQEHLSTENVSRFGFDYTASSTEEDELLDVIAKWQET